MNAPHRDEQPLDAKPDGQQTSGPADSPRISRRLLLAGTAAAGVAVAAVGIPRVLSEPQPRTTDESTTSTSSIDQYHSGDAEFFSSFRLDSGLEVENYATIEQMATSATATVTGKVVDVVSRSIVGEGSDRVGMVGLVIEPTVLNGELPSKHRNRLVVEFIGGSEPAKTTAARLKQSLPKGEAVWFLRAKAEEVTKYEKEMRRQRRRISPATARSLKIEKRYYRLVSSQGFFIQGEDRVENPIAEPEENPGDSLRNEARKIRRMSRLKARVEEAR